MPALSSTLLNFMLWFRTYFKLSMSTTHRNDQFLVPACENENLSPHILRNLSLSAADFGILNQARHTLLLVAW
jgi:hypothetical protein